jgi:hypothetical protein
MESDAEVQRWVLDVAAKQATGTYRREYEKTLMLKIAELLADRNSATGAMDAALEQAAAERRRASEVETVTASVQAQFRGLKEEILTLRRRGLRCESQVVSKMRVFMLVVLAQASRPKRKPDQSLQGPDARTTFP